PARRLDRGAGEPAERARADDARRRRRRDAAAGGARARRRPRGLGAALAVRAGEDGLAGRADPDDAALLELEPRLLVARQLDREAGAVGALELAAHRRPQVHDAGDLRLERILLGVEQDPQVVRAYPAAGDDVGAADERHDELVRGP